MRRTLSALALTILVSGCGTLAGSLPYHPSADDSMGMTVEQYAVGRLPAGRHAARCSKSSMRSVGSVQERGAPKLCRGR